VCVAKDREYPRLTGRAGNMGKKLCVIFQKEIIDFSIEQF